MNNSRLLIIVFLVLFLFAGILAKLFEVQVVKSEELKYYAEKQQTKLETIVAERGFIYDRNNLLLVYNRHDVDIYLDLRIIPPKWKEELPKRFSTLFNNPKSHYIQLMSQQDKTVCIEKKVPVETASKLDDIKLGALFTVDKPTRVYQYGSLASHVLGYLNTESIGMNGVAKYFEKYLKGENGSRIVERDAIGRVVSVADEKIREATPGDNLILTIDKNYQMILEEELRIGIDTYSAASATGIIMNPNTGEILALANIEDYDPNQYWKYDDNHRRNKAITDVYEPGSTFKGLSMAALIDAGKCKEEELVYVENGNYKFGKDNIKDPFKHTYLTVKGILEESSNIGMSKLIQRLDDDTFYKYLRAFGLGNYTSITLPGEVKGRLKKPNQWSNYTKTFMSFGYEVSVTPLQLITAYSAIINGGVLYEPYLLKQRFGKNGDVKFNSSPNAVRRVISEKTSEKLRTFLRSAVKNGTGSLAEVDNITVGGKTGTSQKIIGGKYSHSNHNASFIGFYPAENPKVICLVLLHSPQVNEYGGKVAAPIFKRITERILDVDYQNFQDSEIYDSSPQLNEKIFTSVEAENENLDVVDNSIISVSNDYSLQNEFMPDLRGLSIKEALVTLNSLGLKYDISGSGLVTFQSINPGSQINRNKICQIICSESSISGANIY